MHDAIPESERPRHDAHLSIYGAVDSKEGTVISEEPVHVVLAGLGQVRQDHHRACGR